MTHHAAGASHSFAEWALVFAAAIALVWALGLALRYTLRPEETDSRHIKRRILRDEIDESQEVARR